MRIIIELDEGGPRPRLSEMTAEQPADEAIDAGPAPAALVAALEGRAGRVSESAGDVTDAGPPSGSRWPGRA